MRLNDSDVIGITEAIANIKGIIDKHPDEHPRDKMIKKLEMAGALCIDVYSQDKLSKLRSNCPA